MSTSVNTSVIDRPIFIVGSGRSGTTLLRSLLSAHSRIAVTPETHFIRLAETAGGLGEGRPADFDAFWQEYTSSVRFNDLAVEADRCLELIDRQGDRTYQNMFTALLAAYLERTGKERVGEKTPKHVYFLPHLLAWYPDARVIVLRRDPRAVVSSLLRSPWVERHLTPPSLRGGMLVGSRLSQVALHARAWARVYEEIVPLWRDDPRLLTVSYEALVEDAEREMRAVCAFLGEAYETTMLTDRTKETVPIAAGTSRVPTEQWRQWRQEHHARTLRPVSTNALDKWKDGLSGIEVAMVEGCCAEGMRAAGYAPTTSRLRRLAGRALASTVRAAERAEGAVRPAARKLIGPVYRTLSRGRGRAGGREKRERRGRGEK